MLQGLYNQPVFLQGGNVHLATNHALTLLIKTKHYVLKQDQILPKSAL